MHNHNKIMLKIISIILIVEGALMIVPSLCGVYFDESMATKAFATCAIVYLIVGAMLYWPIKVKYNVLKNRDGMLIGIVSWVIVCIAGAVPIYFSCTDYTPAMSLFESVAGWTTTGAWTIMPIDANKPVIMWKAMSNWIGGIGVLLLATYMLPSLGQQNQKVLNAEGNDIQFSKFAARMKDTPKFSLYIYLVLSAVELALLLASSLPKFDAVVNTMSSVGTAGLINIRKTLVLDYSPCIKTIITVFTVLGSINAMMYFFIATGKFKQVVKNTELRTYLGLLLGSSLIMGIVMTVNHTYDSVLKCFGNAIVQACSYGGTSGFWVDDINNWPATCQMILICLVTIGACNGSTGGSLKVIRFVVFIKLVTRGIYKRIHPRSVKPIMVEGRPISAPMASSITVFILMFFMIFIFSSLVISLEDMPLDSTLSTALACMTNNGTGIGVVHNGFYGTFSSPILLYCSALMLAGRLEFYAIVMLFSRSFWNSDRARY